MIDGTKQHNVRAERRALYGLDLALYPPRERSSDVLERTPYPNDSFWVPPQVARIGHIPATIPKEAPTLRVVVPGQYGKVRHRQVNGLPRIYPDYAIRGVLHWN